MIVSSEHLARPKYASITEEEEIPRTYEWGRIIGLREGRFSYRTIVILVQKNNSTVMRVWKQWTDERRTTRKSCSGTWRQNATIDTCSAWRWMTVQLSPGSWQHVSLLLQVYFINSSTSAALWTVGFGLSASRSLSVFFSFKRGTLTAHTSNMELSSTNRHSKSVWFHGTSDSNTYCCAWWVYQILISDNFFPFKISSFISISILVVCALNFIWFWWFLHGIAFFTNSSIHKEAKSFR